MRFAFGFLILSALTNPPAVAATKHCDLKVLNPALAILEANLSSNPISWTNTIAVDGKLLQAEPIRDLARGHRIIEAVWEHPALPAEVLQGVGLGPTPDYGRFFSVYPAAYDRFVTSIDGYLQLVFMAASLLPKDGRILDLGSFTGTASAVLLGFPQNTRTMVLVDKVAVALRIAQQKLMAVTNGDAARFETYEATIAEPSLFNKPFTGVLMINVAYLNNDETMDAAFALIAKNLPPGGRVVLADPAERMLREPKAMQEWLKANLSNSIANEGAGTEFDGAFMAAMHLSLQQRPDIYPRSSRALADLGRKHGLLVDTVREDMNFNGGSFLVFQKEAK
jgi:SAM-dependent methyltransferase